MTEGMDRCGGDHPPAHSPVWRRVTCQAHFCRKAVQPIAEAPRERCFALSFGDNLDKAVFTLFGVTTSSHREHSGSSQFFVPTPSVSTVACHRR